LREKCVYERKRERVRAKTGRYLISGENNRMGEVDGVGEKTKTSDFSPSSKEILRLGKLRIEWLLHPRRGTERGVM